MKPHVWILLTLSFLTINLRAQKLSELSIIPLPQYVTDSDGFFFLKPDTRIIYKSPHLKPIALYLRQVLDGYVDSLEIATSAPEQNAIVLSIKQPADKSLGTEGYLLQISKQKIEIFANQPAGIFYGIQTLRQILPLKSSSPELPCGTIVDYPNYQYRGMMLDVARHFFTPEQVKQLIDYLALFKINHLHLHLADDQGWRIEIKSFPLLTQIGGSTQVGGGKAGFYTQEQFKDIVSYAKSRFIQIVPEIDMPGHTNAALASYAFLNCDNKTRPLYTGTKVGFSSLCTEKDSVYWFVDKVVGEIASLYDGKYFHIGGDESMATPHDQYLKFIDSVQKIVNLHGKIMIGWDEIAQTKLLPSTIVQFWNNKENLKKAVQQGNRIIFSYAPMCYMDMKYNPQTPIGYRWAGYISIQKAYSCSPETFEPTAKDLIIGIEAPLWTETVKTLDDIEFMTFPRICAYAEIGWTRLKNRDWNSFRKRLANFAPRFKRLGINFYKSALIPWQE